MSFYTQLEVHSGPRMSASCYRNTHNYLISDVEVNACQFQKVILYRTCDTKCDIGEKSEIGDQFIHLFKCSVLYVDRYRFIMSSAENV